MKKIIYLIIISSLLCSCKLKQTILVNGTPGTTIYDVNQNNLATIGPDGVAQFKISENKYHSFLLSVSPDGKVVPFGLDFKKNMRTAKKFFIFLGPYAPSLYYWMSNEQWLDNYSYLKEQKTNEDFPFQPYVETGFKREVLKAKRKQSINKYYVETGFKREVLKANHAPANKEMAGTAIGTSLRNLAGNIAGTYTGEGQLLTDKGRMAERYESLTLQITRVDNHTVTIAVLDNNNESYFDEPQQYSVKKNEDGTYVLTLTSDSEAVISINADGTLDYHHPHIPIDTKNYILNISANR